MAITISVFNNKGGVGKTSILWNLGVALADMDKKVLMIDFDPQCNLSIASIGDEEFAELLETDNQHPFGQTIKAFALPYIQQNTHGKLYVFEPKKQTDRGELNIVPGDFWLNTFSDILNVGTDVVSGSGLYRFMLPSLITKAAQETYDIEYDYVLIDLPPSFNTLVRSALYCSDCFLVPCTPDLFSSYCVGLIGDMLPKFIRDWEQGKQRYLESNPSDRFIKTQGEPKFGGWIFNGFDTRATNGLKSEVGADAAHHKSIKDAVDDKLIHSLINITEYQAVPSFVTNQAVAKIEDLNVMAPDSIIQNIPIKYLSQGKPTRKLSGKGSWASNQITLMQNISNEYDTLAKYIVQNY